jgi:transcriptional regulator with XRE-family HTH domain
MVELDEQELEARRRVVRYVRSLMSTQRLSDPQLADRAGITVDTVRDFLSTERWPQEVKRWAMEEVLGLNRGYLDMLRKGLVQEETAGDPVEQAIDRTDLSRADKLRLKAMYLDMLDAQQGQAQGGGSA